MVREAVDVGIRVGALPDATGKLKLIGRMHRIIGGPAPAHASSWQFERDGGSVSIDVHPHVSANDTAGALAAATGSLGITSTISWASRQELDNGGLVHLLSDWKTAELPVHAYFPMGRTTRMAARAFVDFLARDLQSDPPSTLR